MVGRSASGRRAGSGEAHEAVENVSCGASICRGRSTDHARRVRRVCARCALTGIGQSNRCYAHEVPQNRVSGSPTCSEGVPGRGTGV